MLGEYSKQIEATDVFRIHNSFESLSDDDRDWLARVHAKLGIDSSLETRMRAGVAENQIFLNRVARHLPLEAETPGISRRVLPLVVAWDWSEEFACERNRVNNRIKTAVEKFTNSCDTSIVFSSMSRVAFDLSTHAKCTVFESDGLKFAGHKFVIDELMKTGERMFIQPLVLDTCNRLHTNDNTLRVAVPDACDTLGRLVLTHGTIFDSRFTTGAKCDVVITLFYLETVSCRLAVERIHTLLNKGGVWINCGPISDSTQTREELSFEAINQTIEHNEFFKIVEQEEIPTRYLCNFNSMMKTETIGNFFVAKKL